ncbi:hypothetical protein HaLaN_01772 [Haematococcus lacustris]|uniref:Uncharacterized protein n=1 Tax=Haematococcus lacustris TaxID=44745 RepID=A0A699YCB3_HAELA|nr:hypothetical protein HaLaN_01772 [Haematococcus lacustris]
MLAAGTRDKVDVYIDLARLLADSATAAAGALNASAVHDALSDVWLLAEEDIILRLPKTSDAAHTAVLKDVLAQVTSSARHRGIVMRLLQTATQLRCFRLHLPPAARAAGKGLPPSSIPTGQAVAAAGDVLPPGADLYCGALGAEEVLQRGSLYPGPSPTKAARWAAVQGMLKEAARAEDAERAKAAKKLQAASSRDESRRGSRASPDFTEVGAERVGAAPGFVMEGAKLNSAFQQHPGSAA